MGLAVRGGGGCSSSTNGPAVARLASLPADGRWLCTCSAGNTSSKLSQLVTYLVSSLLEYSDLSEVKFIKLKFRVTNFNTPTPRRRAKVFELVYVDYIFLIHFQIKLLATV